MSNRVRSSVRPVSDTPRVLINGESRRRGFRRILSRMRARLRWFAPSNLPRTDPEERRSRAAATVFRVTPDGEGEGYIINYELPKKDHVTGTILFNIKTGEP